MADERELIDDMVKRLEVLEQRDALMAARLSAVTLVLDTFLALDFSSGDPVQIGRIFDDSHFENFHATAEGINGSAPLLAALLAASEERFL